MITRSGFIFTVFLPINSPSSLLSVVNGWMLWLLIKLFLTVKVKLQLFLCKDFKYLTSLHYMTSVEEMQFVAPSILVTLFIEVRISVPNEHRFTDLSAPPLWVVSCQDGEVFGFRFCVLLGSAMPKYRRCFICSTMLFNSYFFSASSFTIILTFACSTIAIEFVDDTGRVSIVDLVLNSESRPDFLPLYRYLCFHCRR